MTAWAIILDSDVDAESPITESLMFRLRDNSKATFEGDASVPDADLCTLENQRTDGTTTTDVLQPDGANKWTLGPVVLGAAVVNQSALDTSLQTITNLFAGVGNVNLSGGQFGWTIESQHNGTGSGTLNYAQAINTTPYQSRVGFGNVGGGNMDIRQRRVDASPPFASADGNIPLFIWVQVVNKKMTVSIDTVPPWGYNGFTRIRPDKWIVDKKTGIINTKEILLSDLEFVMENYNRLTALGQVIPDRFDIKKMTIDQMLDLAHKRAYVPIDMERKNADKELIPHPFDENGTILLLDPPETGSLLELYKEGVDIGRLIVDGKIEILNDSITRDVPQGVIPVKFKWKDTI